MYPIFYQCSFHIAIYVHTYVGLSLCFSYLGHFGSLQMGYLFGIEKIKESLLLFFTAPPIANF